MVSSFVDLTPLRDPGLVLGAIARRLGVDERDATPLPNLLAVSLRGRLLWITLREPWTWGRRLKHC